MSEFNQKIETIKELLKDCDAVLIGAGAGLSVAAGLDNNGLNFNENFKDFIDAYHITDLYSGGFQKFSCDEEKWAYFSRYFITYYNTKSTSLYENILKLINGKDYFVITTNVDGHFEKSNFDKNKIFATQGDFISIQCSEPCHKKVYESIDLFKEMVEKTKDRKFPSELLPKCPKCGKIMDYHLRGSENFVEDDYWHQQCDAYLNFVKKNKDKKVLVLEFGVGFNTPSIIRFPFEKRTAENENWHLVRINRDYSGLTMEDDYGFRILNDWDSIKSLKMRNNFQNRFIPISEDTNEVIQRLLN